MSDSSNSSYWCYRCARFVSVTEQLDSPTCPNCTSGFLEQIQSSPPPSIDLRRSQLRHRHRSSATGSNSPFNPVILLRNNPSDPVPETRFDLYYDDGSGSGLRPLPASMSEFLMGSGFDRLLDQLSTIGSNIMCERNPPASKAVIESLPVVKIEPSNDGDSYLNCAVCIDRLEVGTEAREMPCKHLYHEECIFPWLSVRNTCPVCRHEVPPESNPQSASQEEGEAVGMTIWRLPGGGYAVGRFAGGREVPVVYTEMDGNGFGSSSGSEPRRVSWNRRRERVGESREGGGIGRAFRNFIVSLWRTRSNSSENANNFTSRRSLRHSSSSSSGSRVLRIHRGGGGSQILH